MVGWWRRTALAGCCLILPIRMWAAPGDLDSSLDDDGMVVTAVPDEANAVIVQPDRRIVIAGVSSHAVMVRRYLEDGSLDPTFGSAGMVRTPVGTVSSGYALTRQPDGKLLVVGRTDLDVLVLRYDASGALDPSFGTAGMAITAVGDRESTAYAVLVQPDGSVAVAGASRIGTRQGFAVVRYQSDGSLDDSFGGGDGIVTTAFDTASSTPFAMARQADGKLVVGGISGGDIALARYEVGGALDPSFGGDGRITVDLGGSFDTVTSLVVPPDGRVVTAGRADIAGAGRIALAALLPNGDLDPSFDGDGIVLTALPGSISSNATGLALQPDGKLILGGTARFEKPAELTVEDHFVGVRYHGNGSLDPTFGHGDGIVTTPIGSSASASDLALADDGRIVLAGDGYIASGYGLILVRYLGDEQCGNAVREGAEECDDGNLGDGDCCAPTCRVALSGTVCRVATGPCDVADACDGTTADCPADAMAAGDALCRAASDVCDQAERCDGFSPSCPADAVLAAGTPCRAAAGACDSGETCDGLSTVCPVDAKSADVCRLAVGLCDRDETCDGVGNDCPVDAFAPAGTICRLDAGPCDIAEVCGGTPSCPNDTWEPDGTTCDDDNACTTGDACSAGACLGGQAIECTDGNPCSADSCTPAGGCAHDNAPAEACRRAERGSLLLSGGSDERRHRWRWDWSKGDELAAAELADPTLNAAYGLCVYVGVAQTRAAAATLPVGSDWSSVGAVGYRFRGQGADGLSSALLKGGAAGRSKAFVKGKGPGVPDLQLPLAYPVTVQLRREGSPLCLESTFDPQDEVRNDAAQFKARR